MVDLTSLSGVIEFEKIVSPVLTSEAISAIFGALIGGGFSLLGSWYSIKRNYELQKASDEEKELNMIASALNSVYFELAHNLQRAEDIITFLKDKQMDEINFSEHAAHHNFKMDRWEKHRDTIEMMSDYSNDIGVISAFYYNVSMDIKLNHCNLERTKLLHEQCSMCKDLINDQLIILNKKSSS